VNIANNYNVFDNGVGILSHHVLVGSVIGESVTLEFANGAFQAVTSEDSWQVLTNIPVYNIPHNQLMNSCWRYNSLYTELEENGGVLSWSEGMDALEAVHINCPWSAIYDLNNNGIYISVHNNYEDITWTDLEDFSFTVFVGIDSRQIKRNDPGLIHIFPNPFCLKTTITMELPVSGHVELSVYNGLGMKIKTFLDGKVDAGKYQYDWDSKGGNGDLLVPGIYWCILNTGGQKVAVKVVKIG